MSHPSANARCAHDAARRLAYDFPLTNGYPSQVVNPGSPASLVMNDLSTLSADAQAAMLNECVVAEARRIFDLAHDSLLRCVLFRLHEQAHVLLLVTHHIVFDAWSAMVLLREFLAIYDAFSVDHPLPLSDLPIHYTDFAVWQREHMHRERSKRTDVLEGTICGWASSAPIAYGPATARCADICRRAHLQTPADVAAE